MGVDEQTFMFLSRVKLLKRLPPEELPTLAKKSQAATFKAGETICKQGDEGNEFFMIKKGKANVDIDGKQVATLKGGDYFGENALLRNEPRTATITAIEELSGIKITRKLFAELGLDQKLAVEARGAVGAGASDEVEVKPPSPKDASQVKFITDAIKNNKNLTSLDVLDDKKAAAMAEKMWLETVASGTAVITQGDLKADYFYVVKKGTFEITVAEEAQSAGSAVGTAVGSLSDGQSFGELALLYTQPRAATITAKAESELYVLARNHFKEALRADDNRVATNLKICGACEFLKGVDASKMQLLAEAMREMRFDKDECIFEQGEMGSRFFILVGGKVEVVVDGKAVTTLEGSEAKAQVFGEKALESNAPRNATIKVLSDAMTLYAEKNTYDQLIKGQASVAPTAGSKRFGNIKRKDLKVLGLLGCGGFGAVNLVENTSTGETYALKLLSKGYVVKTKMQKSIMSEKNVQLLCDSLFVVMLYECFNGKEHLEFLLELALGGELYATYNKKNLWGKVDYAKFYVAGTLFAFEHLHSKNIVYRDLKPENLLLTEKGRVKLTDMGLAKVCIGKTYTTCGTPDYFAPELIASKGHNQAVDWWTLGILTFELNVGHPPFESATPMQIYSKVQKGINKVAFPKNAKGDIETLVKGLCHSDPTQRLPMKKGETQNIKNAAWYKGFDWGKMFDQTLDPPFVPPVKSKKDIANFNARKEDMPPQVKYVDPKDGWDKDFATSD